MQEMGSHPQWLKAPIPTSMRIHTHTHTHTHKLSLSENTYLRLEKTGHTDSCTGSGQSGWAPESCEEPLVHLLRWPPAGSTITTTSPPPTHTIPRRRRCLTTPSLLPSIKQKSMYASRSEGVPPWSWGATPLWAVAPTNLHNIILIINYYNYIIN